MISKSDNDINSRDFVCNSKRYCIEWHVDG